MRALVYATVCLNPCIFSENKDFKELVIGEVKKWTVNGERKRRELTSIENLLVPLTLPIFSQLILPITL